MAASRKPATKPGIPGKPKTDKKPTVAPSAKKTAPKTAKPAAQKKPAAVKKPAPKPAAKPTAAKKPAPKPVAKPAPGKPQADKKTVVPSKAAPRKPLPGAAAPIPGVAPAVPAQIIDFLDRFDALKPGKAWSAKAAGLVEKVPAALFGDFEDALDLGTPLSTGRIPLHLIDPRTAKAGAAKSPKGGGLTVRPVQKTFGTAILGNKIGREELEELVERLRCCLCCCHCWPCRPWPFCRICRRCLVKVSSTADTGWVSHLNFQNASALIADREAKITCPSGGSTGGPWAPQVWNTSTPAAAAPVGYSEDGHDHDGEYAPISGSANYAPANGSPNYAPKQKSGANLKYVEMDNPGAADTTVKLRDVATSPSPADVTLSRSNHNHDAAYAPKQKSGADIKYVELRSVDTTGKTATFRDVVTTPTPTDIEVSLKDHVHRKSQAGRLENPLSAAGGLVTVNLSNMTPTVLTNIQVHATAFGIKTMVPIVHIPLYISKIEIGGSLSAPTATFTIQHQNGTAYDSGDASTWGANAKMILSFIASENF